MLLVLGVIPRCCIGDTQEYLGRSRSKQKQEGEWEESVQNPFLGRCVFCFTARMSLGTNSDCKLPELVSPQGGKEPKRLAVLQDFSCPQASKPDSAMIHPTFRVP